MENFKEVIERIEDHCGKPFDWNDRRMRFQLEQHINRMIGEHKSLKQRIQGVLNGAATYNDKTHRLHTIPQKDYDPLDDEDDPRAYGLNNGF